MAGAPESAAVQLSRAMSAKTKVPVRSLNPYIVCKLCVGYIVDATTIVECLHSFCRACIVKYFDNNRFCPICDVQVHKTKPLLSLRSDTILQSLIYKIVPSLYQREMNRRQKFLAENPTSDPPGNDDDTSGILIPAFFSPDDTISLSLEYIDNEESEPSPNVSKEKQMIHKRYLQCPAAVSMRHLKKFVRMKYGLGNEFQVDIVYESENLADDFSLMDVAYTFKWHRTTPMRFSYRISERPPPLLLGPHQPPSGEPVQTESPPPGPPLPPSQPPLLPPQLPPPPPPPTRAPRPPTRSTSSFSGDEGSRRRNQRRQQRQRSAKTAAYSALEAMDESTTDVEDRDDEDYDEVEDPEPVFKKARRNVHAGRHVAAPGARTPRPSVVDSETRYGRTPGGKVPVYMMGQSSKAFQVKNCQVTVVDVQKHAQHVPTSPPVTPRSKDLDEYEFESPNGGAHLDDEDIEQQAEAMIEEVIEDEEDEDEVATAAAEEAQRAAEAAAAEAAAAAAAAEAAEAAEAAAAARRSSSSMRKRKKAKHHHHHHKHRDKDKRRLSELTPTLIPSPDSEMKLTLKLRPCKTPDTPQPASPADSTTTPPTPASVTTSRLSSASSESPEPVSSSTGKAESPPAPATAEDCQAPPPPAVSPPTKTEEAPIEKVHLRIVRKTPGAPTPSPVGPAATSSPSHPALPALKTPASLTVSKISAGDARPSGKTPPPISTSRPSLEILLVPASPPPAEAEPEPDTTALPEHKADAVGALDLSGKSTRTTMATTPTSAITISQRPVKTNPAAMRNLMTLSDTAVHVQNLMATQECALCPSSRPAPRPARPPQSASTPPTATPAAIPPPSAMTRPGPNQTVRHIPNPSALLQRNNHLLLQAQALAARDINERLKTLPSATAISNNNNTKFNNRPTGIIGRMDMARNIEKVAAGLTMRAVEARAGK